MHRKTNAKILKFFVKLNILFNPDLNDCLRLKLILHLIFV